MLAMTDIVILATEGLRVTLTTASPASSYGVPVLQIESAAGDIQAGDYGPSDIVLAQPPDGCGPVLAADVVVAWAAEPRRSEAERDAARRFLRQWPEGPQLD